MKISQLMGCVRSLRRVTCVLATILPVLALVCSPVFSQSPRQAGAGFTNQGLGEEAHITLTINNSIIAAGQTVQTTLPNSGQPQSTNGGASDGYIVVYSTAGTIVWSTFLGGSQPDAIRSAVVTSSNVLILTGVTESSDFPVTDGSTLEGPSGAFVAAINLDTQSLVYSSILSSTSIEIGHNLIQLSDGRVALVGEHTSNGVTTGFVAVQPPIGETGSRLVLELDGPAFGIAQNTNGNLIVVGGYDTGLGFIKGVNPTTLEITSALDLPMIGQTVKVGGNGKIWVGGSHLNLSNRPSSHFQPLDGEDGSLGQLGRPPISKPVFGTILDQPDFATNIEDVVFIPTPHPVTDLRVADDGQVWFCGPVGAQGYVGRVDTSLTLHTESESLPGQANSLNLAATGYTVVGKVPQTTGSEAFVRYEP
ncbi:MAG: hypothetical protein HY774_06895 [Acidobacteria bacterium]|nr:hypothetical protein [Acidobacteriota bacterium]